MSGKTSDNGFKLDRNGFYVVKAFTDLGIRKLKELQNLDVHTFKEFWDAVHLQDVIKQTLDSGKPCFFTVENVIPEYQYLKRSVKLSFEDLSREMRGLVIPMIPGDWETEDYVGYRGEKETIRINLGLETDWEAHSKFLAAQMLQALVNAGLPLLADADPKWLNNIRTSLGAQEAAAGNVVVGHMIQFIERIPGCNHMVRVLIQPMFVNLVSGTMCYGYSQDLTVDDREINLDLSEPDRDDLDDSCENR